MSYYPKGPNKRALLLWCVVAMLTSCSPESSAGDPSTEGGTDTEVSTADARADAGSENSTDARSRTDGESPALGIVKTEQGPVRGQQTGKQNWRFGKIPYAKPPVGPLRWSAPKPPSPRDGMLRADQMPPACPQQFDGMGNQSIPETSEDCLYLNIWTPRPDDRDRPVLFWIHGGGLIQGASATRRGDGQLVYNGDALADQGVVVVTINYRLGPIGFLAHPSFRESSDGYPASGNYGILDQIRALKWVHRNIDRFGGDPDAVTIFGESAGGVSVCGLAGTPLADGLFDGAIMQSGNCLVEGGMKRLETPTDKEPAFEQGREYASVLGCESGRDTASCLRRKPVSQVINAKPMGIGLDEKVANESVETFEPVIDGHVFERSIARALRDGTASDFPFAMGVNANEATVFIPAQTRAMTASAYRASVQQTFPNIGRQVLEHYPVDEYEKPWRAWSAILTDLTFVCPTRRAAAEYPGRSFLYVFTHVRPEWNRLGLGAFHGSEIGFVFYDDRPGWRQMDRRLARAMTRAWARFATESEPGPVADINWPGFKPSRDVAMEFKGAKIGTIRDFRAEKCAFWKSYVDL